MVEFSVAEEDFLAYSEGASIQRPIERISLRISVDAHVGETGAETCFHPGAKIIIQRAPVTARTLDGVFYFRSGFRLTFRLSCQCQEALHEAIAVRLLESKQRSHCPFPRRASPK